MSVGTPRIWFELRDERRDTCPHCGALIAWNVNPGTGEEMPVHLPGAERRDGGKVFAESHYPYCNSTDPWATRRARGRAASWHRK